MNSTSKSAIRYTIIVILLSAISAVPAHAKNPIRQAFFQNYPSAVGSALDTLPSRSSHCGVCHYDFSGGGTRNPYGLAVQSNLNSGNSNAVWLVRNLDSDGDGFANIVEITNTVTYGNTPTFPGLRTSNTNLVSSVSLADIAARLTPAVGADTTPPTVQLTMPNGGQSLTANQPVNITWSASDSSGIASVSLHLSLNNGATYQPLTTGLANSGTFSWVPANRPTAQARIKVIATDMYSNSASDVSDSVFAIVSPPFTNAHGVPTTLRDFDMPGTQPFEHGMDLEASASCASCHGGYDTRFEPHHTWQGSMMAHASRDPIFLANLAIANQDAPESGDLCLRCHFPRGWLAGRSVPTDGSRMTAADADGVSCALCHRMTDPVYIAGFNPTNDLAILAALSFPGTNYGNGMVVVDPSGTQRGPFADVVAPHAFVASSFHQRAAFCGTCHDVSNPAFQNDGAGNYAPNALNAAAETFSPHGIGPVERTYSEWLHSAYNSPVGVHAPQFAGNKSGGMVSTCQDCHMRDVSGYGCNPTNNPALRHDLPLHDMTGGSTWVPGLLTNLYPNEVNAAAIEAGIIRATYLLQNAATLGVGDASGQLKITVTNQCGHKLPTGYPEGRRVWLNVQFFDDAQNLLAESGAYNFTNGVLTRDTEAKIYEVHPGIDTNIAGIVGLDAGPSLHFVLNNKVYEDNRIPPRGFTNSAYAAFGGAPVGHHYGDGQFWDETLYTPPPNATRAEVRLYYQSTSKEFVEFLRDENTTNTKGQELYDLWNNNGKCPPTLMAQATWLTAFAMRSAQFMPEGKFRIEFVSRPGVNYTIEYKDSVNAMWQNFVGKGSQIATGTLTSFEDDFTAETSGGISATGERYYRFKYTSP